MTTQFFKIHLNIFQTFLMENAMRMTAPIPHDDVDDVTKKNVSQSADTLPYMEDDLLDDDYVIR